MLTKYYDINTYKVNIFEWVLALKTTSASEFSKIFFTKVFNDLNGIKLLKNEFKCIENEINGFLSNKIDIKVFFTEYMLLFEEVRGCRIVTNDKPSYQSYETLVDDKINVKPIINKITNFDITLQDNGIIIFQLNPRYSTNYNCLYSNYRLFTTQMFYHIPITISLYKNNLKRYFNFWCGKKAKINNFKLDLPLKTTFHIKDNFELIRGKIAKLLKWPFETLIELYYVCPMIGNGFTLKKFEG